MPHAIRFEKTGGPEVLKWTEYDPGPPKDGEVRVKHTAISVNFVDTMHRRGQYPVELPSGVGLAGVGIVDAVGGGVQDFKKGDRVGYTTGPLGAYAEFNNVKAEQAVAIPDDIDDKTVAAVLMRGLTAWYLLFKTYPVKKGDFIVVHAASGGVGHILCRWGKEIGANVIGLVGSPEKVEEAKKAGAAHVLVSREPFADKVKEIADGKGAHIVYDSVGKETFQQSLKSLRPRGMLALFGTASGMPEPFDPRQLAEGGSLYLTRPSLTHYVATKAELQEGADALWQAVRKGIAPPQIGHEFALKDAAKAHETLEGRKAKGTIILLP